MNKWAKLQYTSSDYLAANAVRRKNAPDRLQARLQNKASTGDEFGEVNLGELWQAVAFWISRMAPGDPKRRLLELAQLRHDSRLAGVVLRHL